MATRTALAMLVLALAVSQTAQAASLVDVKFYGESLCPYCANFTIYAVAPLFKNGIADIMQFNYIPWGNAKYSEAHDEITCQHGELECALNALQSCAIDAYPEQKQWFPYVLCLEQNARGKPDYRKESQSCAVSAQLDARKIEDCLDGERGEELQMAAKEQTDALDPSHEGVPWVLVNGVPLFDNTDALKSIVCAAYGGDRPKACFQDTGASVMSLRNGKARKALRRTQGTAAF